MVAALLRHRLTKPVLHLLCLLPLGWIVWLGLSEGLGANPVERVLRFLGDWALYMLLICLAVTPLRVLSGAAGVMRFRRMLGLYAFFYALLHVIIYTLVDKQLAWAVIFKDITKRPYITLGLFAVLLLLALAATSPKKMVGWLGGRRWRKLHWMIYPAAIAAILHYFLLVRADTTTPLITACILALLLAVRVWGRKGVNQ